MLDEDHFCYDFAILLTVNCTWATWTDDSACSKTCENGKGDGIKSQIRRKIRSEKNSGECDNKFTRIIPCTTDIDCPSK